MKFYSWIEQYLFFPNTLQRLISFVLLPLSLVYCIIVLIKRFLAKKIDFGIPIISIGNIIIGGSGKTPITISIAKDMDDIAVVLRGYGRKSKGLVVVSQNGTILTDVATSGDEAMLLAKSLPKATIIVSEDRLLGIQKAKDFGAKIVFLDDGFSKSYIKKLDILIKPKVEPTNIFCIPSGGYRESIFMYSKADILLQDGVDFVREVNIKNPTKNMVLITSISKPARLNEYIDETIQKYYFPDHYMFCQSEIANIVENTSATSILVTTKDYVKLENFDFVCSILELNISLKQEIKDKINQYIKDYK